MGRRGPLRLVELDARESPERLRRDVLVVSIVVLPGDLSEAWRVTGRVRQSRKSGYRIRTRPSFTTTKRFCNRPAADSSRASISR